MQALADENEKQVKEKFKMSSLANNYDQLLMENS